MWLLQTLTFLQYQTAAETAETNAETAETNAETAETNAATSASNASTSASTATTQATNAGNSATASSNSATASANSATASGNSASTASGHATTATTQATKSQNYAIKVDGAITGSEYSSKAWATGGTGIDNASGGGSAKDWATDTTNTVDNTEYSAKEYAIGVLSAQSNGSAKQWALGGGNSFNPSTAVSGSLYSAKYWADYAASVVGTFDERYYGSYASDAAAENAHEAAGKTVAVGDLYYNTTSNVVRYCQVAPSGTGAPVGTWQSIAQQDLSGFATNGFSIAMSIAL